VTIRDIFEIVIRIMADIAPLTGDRDLSAAFEYEAPRRKTLVRSRQSRQAWISGRPPGVDANVQVRLRAGSVDVGLRFPRSRRTPNRRRDTEFPELNVANTGQI
jgi:hypothetical protein